MNVYAESGFVVALALRQGDYEAAEKLLGLARQRCITLKLPAFSLSEPFSTIRYRANNRNRLIAELDRELRELRRTQPHQAMAQELRSYTIQMARVLQTQLDSLEAVVLEISRQCILLPLDSTTLTRAAAYKTAYSLQLPDAIVLASITIDLEREQITGQPVFVSQNTKDFENPAIQALLQALQCTYLGDFTNAARFVERFGTTPDQPSAEAGSDDPR